MLRLSRKGWNNVLIFSTLFMIFLFNGMHHKLFTSSESQSSHQAIIPQTELILTLDMPNLSIERIGRGWRIVPEPKTNISEQRLHSLLQNWKNLTGERLASDDIAKWQSETPNKVAVFWFAGATQGYVIKWFNNGSEAVLNSPAGWFSVSQNQPLNELWLTQ
ncbi:hypothetical protein [Catenovulum adriaticum]|uniref:DUF4340 domain-containing protein n=1 Tax=Catenovulum adriaticum TaxID=2984846 RepID=A0ABY7AKM8_9ALTE|nr:hypothetical protein [Catenovulum sp. TS8]WAJ70100.1 hypothetical protein OLW01_13295 [Catenovulum sp. TS8]